jgi:hypothetical protein
VSARTTTGRVPGRGQGPIGARARRDPRPPPDALLTDALHLGEHRGGRGAGGGGGGGEPPDPRAALMGRLDECWARLEDVVSELAALHEVNEESIVERTRGTIAAEQDPDTPA